MRVSEGRERARERERERERERVEPHERVEYLALIRANATNAYLKVFLFKSMSLARLCASECVCLCVCVRAATFPQSLRPTRCAFFNSSLRCLCWNAHAHIYSQLMLFKYSKRQTALQFRIMSDHVLDTSGQLYQHLRRVSHSYNTGSLDQWHDDIFLSFLLTDSKIPILKCYHLY